MRSARTVFPPVRAGARCARLALFLAVLPAVCFFPRVPDSFGATTAYIVGIVRDAESGEPVVKAVVSLPAFHRSVLTDEAGRYVIEAEPGTHLFTVSRMGYAPKELEALVPEAGDLEIRVEMRREPIRFPAIEVHATLPVRGLTPALNAADRTVTREQLNQDPILVEPDYLRAMSGGDVAIDPENPSGLHVRGGASDQVNYMVDGVPVFNPYHSSGTFSAWNPDALSQVDLLASAATPAAPDALSGTVSAHTRTPGRQFHSRGSVSATQVRATFDGPLGRTATGYLLSVTSAFPGLAFHKSESSHLDGDNLDLIAKTESPLLGGALHLIGYGSRNQVDTAATGESAEELPITRSRNSFGWESGSFGAEWSRSFEEVALVARSWYARGDVDATWSGSDSLAKVESSRREIGAVAMVQTPFAGGHTTLGVRLQRISSSYDYRPVVRDSYSLDVSTPVSTAFVEHARDLHSNVRMSISLRMLLRSGIPT